MTDIVSVRGNKMVDPKFKHCAEAARSSLGYTRKDSLVKILRRDYQKDVDWVCIIGPRGVNGGCPPRAYYVTDECLRLLGYRCSSRCVSRPSQPIKLGDREVHHIRRYHPKEEELIGFLMRAYSRKHSCRVQHGVGPYRVDMLIDDYIVVECDEDNHAGYDVVKEAERHKFLETRGYTVYSDLREPFGVFKLSRAAECANWSQNGRIADKYMLSPRGFKKLLMRARTEQGDAATDYFLEIEDALLAYNTLKRTNAGVSQFDSSAKARRNGLRLSSVTDSINTHVSGLYFGVPERTWDMLRPLNPSYSPSLLAVDRAEMTVIKFGMKRGDTDRTEQHGTAFQGFYLLDHVPTEHMSEVEDLLKAWLRNEGLLFPPTLGVGAAIGGAALCAASCEAGRENRKSRDTELTVVVTQADYARVVERTLLLIKQVDDRKRRLLGVGECAREEEARAEQEKAKARQEEAKIVQESEKSRQMAEKTAHLAFKTRMAELELVKLGLLPAQALPACQSIQAHIM